MAKIFRNPDLPDYFQESPGDSSAVEAYESGRVVLLRTRLSLDFDFWSGLPVDQHPGLKKLVADADDDSILRRNLAKASVPDHIGAPLADAAAQLVSQLMPIHEALFAGYQVTRRKLVWRLNSTMNENMHVDTYKEPNFDHFARIFVNLDNQPRIWATSWPLRELYSRYGATALQRLGSSVAPARLHTELNRLAFGGAVDVWWDNQPRHVTYFEPGDVWIVDSRQVSHQIFYGRRALSMDFQVEASSMADPNTHYLSMARDFIASQDQQLPVSAD